MKKLGFGLMRLPMNGDKVDTVELCKMVDMFISRGFTYFDTAHGYVNELSELAVKECLTSRYPRDKYTITDKLTENYFNKEEDIIPFFNSQLEACGVEYFDYYLMHALNDGNYPKYERCNAFDVAIKLKAEGKIKHLGMSFHDKAEVLDKILTQHPEIEVVQIQFNYVDYNDTGIESRKCYDVCEKHNKPVIIMEPVKGGSLVNLPDSAKAILDELNQGSYASYAIRFSASFERNFMVLSGMSNLEQLDDNTSYMENFIPFGEKEFEAVTKVANILRNEDTIACTACHYCTAGCPKKINIPELFSCYNAKKTYKDWNSDFYYGIHTKEGGKASDCIGCKQCEKVCPQHLEIRQLLKTVSQIFD